MTEKVFVVPAYAINEMTKNNVLNALPDGYFYERDAAETNEKLKQIIPYVTITRKADKKILAYKRSKQAGEGRLHNKWSVGFGGHVNPTDLPEYARDEFSFVSAVNREITEELEWTDGLADDWNTLSMDKIIYDDSNEVGRVHLGLGFSLTVDCDPEKEYPMIGDDEIGELRWVTKEEALELENLEGWSVIVLS